MKRRAARIRVGTSGWHYSSWVGPFYPHDAKPPSFLAHYTERFDCVEVNTTFYRLPQRRTVEAWAAQAREPAPAGPVPHVCVARAAVRI